MRKRTIALLPFLVFVCAVPAAADVVVEFDSGLYMKVHSYRLLTDNVRLHLTPDSYLIVPRSTLAKIESDGRVVYRHSATPPSYILADNDFEGELPPLTRRPRVSPAAVAGLAPAAVSRR